MTTTFNVVVTDPLAGEVDVEHQMIAAAGGTLQVAHGDRSDVLETIGGADGILNTYFPLDREAIEGLERCRVIARYGIGVDNVDLAAAREAGIAVTNVPDYCVDEVATHTVACILSLLRRLKQGDELVRSGGWGVGHLGPIHRLSTLTVGLVGYGRIARRVHELLAPFGCSFLVADPYVTDLTAPAELVSLPEVLSGAHVVSLHCPLTDETRGLISAATLAQMQDGALLVNASRGPLVVLDDLVSALRTGKLAGAALDTFDPEPPPSGQLQQVPGLLASPHSAYFSVESVVESRRKATSQILKVLVTGEPLDYEIA